MPPSGLFGAISPSHKCRQNAAFPQLPHENQAQNIWAGGFTLHRPSQASSAPATCLPPPGACGSSLLPLPSGPRPWGPWAATCVRPLCRTPGPQHTLSSHAALGGGSPTSAVLVTQGPSSLFPVIHPHCMSAQSQALFPALGKPDQSPHPVRVQAGGGGEPTGETCQGVMGALGHRLAGAGQGLLSRVVRAPEEKEAAGALHPGGGDGRCKAHRHTRPWVPWVPGPQGEGGGDDKLEAGGRGRRDPRRALLREKAQRRQGPLQVLSGLGLTGPPACKDQSGCRGAV